MHYVNFIFFVVCNEVYSSMKGTIKSPDYPNKYPNNANCRYLIKIPNTAARITLYFRHFRLQNSDSILVNATWRYFCKDYVKIYDGDNTNATVLGNADGYCGHNSLSLIATGNTVLIVFVSDDKVRSSGFTLSYKAYGKFKYPKDIS